LWGGERTRFIQAEGYRVLRFWNDDISQNIDGVLERIHRAMSPTMIFDEPVKHERHNDTGDSAHPTRRASRADPPPPEEGEESK